MRSVTTIERNGSQLTIKTDNRPRKLMSWHDLPTEFQSWFDYVQDDDRYSGRFVKFMGEWYDVNDSVVPGSPWAGSPDMFPGWGSYVSDSLFSGVLFRYAPDSGHEEIIVGRYYC